MADYTYSKEGLGRVSPENAIEVAFEDLEPLITPERIRKEHLLGVPLVSGAKDPITKQYYVIQNDDIKTFIVNAVSLAQLESKIDMFPVQYREKQAFDRCEYQSWGYFQLRHRPVSSIEQLTVTTSSETPVYQVPLEWIDVGYLHVGQFNILPLTISVKEGQIVPLLAGPGGSAFLALFGGQSFIPAFWEAVYTTGFKDGKLPKAVNQYIGVIASMELLSQLAATHARSTSTSLSLDGTSQSVGGLGPELYNNILAQLASKRKWLMTRLKALYGQSILTSNV